jgi:hypothetical protein
MWYANLGSTFLWNGAAAKNYLTINASGDVSVDHDPVKALDVATKQYVDNEILVNGGEVPGSNPPLMDGIASPGMRDPYSREDHIHPSDTSRAPVDSPVFTTQADAPTPIVGDNSTKSLQRLCG